MDPITLMLLVGGGIVSGLIGQHQQNVRQRQQAELERQQREAAAAVAERRREQVLSTINRNRAEVERMAESIRRGAEYSGLEAGASRQASRNVAAANAAAALSGIGDSGAAQSAAGAIMADAIGQTGLARQQDQLQRESAIAQNQAQLQQLAAQLLQDPAFNVGSGEELTAGLDVMAQGQNPFLSAIAGGLGAVMPYLNMQALRQVDPEAAGAAIADAAAATQGVNPFSVGSAYLNSNPFLNTQSAPAAPAGQGFSVNPFMPGSPLLNPQVPQLPQSNLTLGGGS